MSRPGDEALLGRTIAGKYLIESFIGGGAMGAVYRARQKEIDKLVAIKVLHRELLTDPQFAARFKREAKAASRMDHPNSMRVLDFGEEPDGLCYIAMELLDGKSLFQIIRDESPLPRGRVVDLMRQTLAALAVAHEMGVVHRDLKPENIIVLQATDDEGRVTEVVKVCDFGMAKITASRNEQEEHSSEKLTSHGVVVGTPEYMSPEQGRGEPLDGRSDIYSVGVMLYQLIAGRLPFQAETAVGVLLKHLIEEPALPSQHAPDVDPALEAVCIKAMRKRREDRYATAREMRTDLAAAGSGDSVPRSRATQQVGAPLRGEMAVRGTGVSEGAAAESRRLGEAATVQVMSPLSTVGPMTARPVTARSVIRARALLSEPPELQRRSVLPAVFGVLILAAGVAAAIVWAARPQLPWLSFLHLPQAPAATAPPAAVPDDPLPVVPGATAEQPMPPASASSSPSSSPAMASSASAGPSAGALAAPPFAAPSTSSTVKPPPIVPQQQPGTLPVTVPSTMPAFPPAVAPPPAASSPPPPAASAAPGPFDAAHVVVGAIHADHASSADVLGALPVGRYNQCYREGLRTRGSPAGGAASLHLDIDGDGTVSQATFAGTEALAPTGRCIANATIGRRVHTEPGASGADVDLSFKTE